MTRPRHGEVRHGYTLADIHNIASAAVGANFGMAADRTDLYEAAWGAIVEALLIVSHWPTPHDLAIAGRKGIWELARSNRSAYGYVRDDFTSEIGSGPRFARYWSPGSPHDFTEMVVERIAARQVTAAVRPRDREILQAVAAAGDYDLAGRLLGLATHTTSTMAAQARRRWLTLWHDRETPPRTLKRPLRRTRGLTQESPCGTPGAYRRHLRRGEGIDPACRNAYIAHERERTRRKREKAARAT